MHFNIIYFIVEKIFILLTMSLFMTTGGGIGLLPLVCSITLLCPILYGVIISHKFDIKHKSIVLCVLLRLIVTTCIYNTGPTFSKGLFVSYNVF